VTQITLSKNLRDFLKKRDLEISPRFYKGQILASDHFGVFMGRSNESQVKSTMAKTARMLQFMDVTGFRPSTADVFKRDRYSGVPRLPGQDHAIIWRDPDTTRLLMMDEPYEGGPKQKEERSAWCKSRDYEIRRLDWGGTYYPEGGAICDLVSHLEKGIPLGQVIDAFQQAPPVFREDTANWIVHETHRIPPTNGERAEKAAQEAEKAKKSSRKTDVPKRAPRTGTSLSYGNSGSKRPNGTMPLERHAEIGLLLGKVAPVVSERQGARSAITSLRSMLEDWADAETKGKLGNQELFKLYYGETPRVNEIYSRMSFGYPEPDLKSEALSAMGVVRKIVVEGYPDGAGRDRALKLVDKALKSLEGLKTRG
jgi:hypothetical protein